MWQTYIIFIREIIEAKLGRGKKKSRWRDRNVNGMKKANQKKRGTLSEAGLFRKDGAERKRRERETADSLHGLAAVIWGTVNMSTLVQSLGLSPQLEACNTCWHGAH